MPLLYKHLHISYKHLYRESSHVEEYLIFSGLGLSLSGCEREETNAALVSNIVASYPGLANHYKVRRETKT